jgi:chromosome segregation ATPase
MSNNEFARTRIFEIADNLLQRGAAVSPSAVRQAMDNREPYSKVARDLEQWRGEHESHRAVPDVAMLDDVEGTLKSVMEIVWRAAVIQARGEIRNLRDSISAHTSDLESRLNDAIAEIARLENENQFQGRQLDDVTGQLQRAEAALTSRETESATLREQFQELRRRERELQDKVESLATRVGSAETEVRTMRGGGGSTISPHTVEFLPLEPDDEIHPPAH